LSVGARHVCYACSVRCSLLFLALLACSGSDRAQPVQRIDRVAPPSPAKQPDPTPGLRLPEGVTPLHYDVTLDVDPDSETFTGATRIRIRIERPTARIWIHADELDIAAARLDNVELTSPPSRGDQMLGFGLGRTLPPGEHELSFTYTGRTTGDQEGLFRQQAGGRWYLFSQGESVFARRITPCFDEPKFKTPWRLTLVVPKQLAVLANTAEESTKVEGARKRVRFAETPVMASYLVTIAVGPFDVVDAGTVGKQRIPVRVAVRAGAGKQVGVVASKLPAIVSALEAYVGEPLPLAKLDFVAVPQFFGAMENPGLITAEAAMLVGKESKQRVAYFTHVAAHEIAHQWFGNSVTPAWWDDLWLSESFASFVGDKVSGQLGAFDDRPLHAVNERREALEADSSPAALPLHRPIEGNQDPDDSFDAIAYQKGEAVLATFEALVGADAFRTVMREYLAAHRDASATAHDFVTVLARATKPDIGTAFEQYALQAGVPVVDVSLRCDANPTLLASARDGRLVPVCVRYAGAKSPVCLLATAKSELPLAGAKPGTCPAWITANAFAGYYHVHWRDRAATHGLAQLDLTARALVGDDLAATFRRGELSAKDALAELRTLLASDLNTQVAAIPLAQEIDELVDDSTRPAWSAWLAPRVPKLKRGRNTPLVTELVHALRPLLLPRDRLAADELRKARDLVAKLIDADQFPDPQLLAIVAGSDGKPLFERVVGKAFATRDTERREHWLRLLGVFPAEFATPIAALLRDKGELSAAPIWTALEHYFERPAARVAAWQALRAHLDVLIKRATHRAVDMIDATAWLCDQLLRDEVATAFAPYLARITGGRAHLDRALAAIDRCIARRAKVGDLAAAIASSR
jgi:cytosol alanyl aminopeptidase